MTKKSDEYILRTKDIKNAYENGCDDVKSVLKTMCPDLFKSEDIAGEFEAKIQNDGDCHVIRLYHKGQGIGFVDSGGIITYENSEYKVSHLKAGPIMRFRISRK